MGGLPPGTDAMPGIRRRGCGKGFSYTDPSGATLRGAERARVAALAIPPAWTDVWICPDPHGRIQATGRDRRGRKQYIYHTDWRKAREARKFERLEPFGEALPALRERVAADLALRGMRREKAVAAVVRTMDRSFIRVGSRRYASQNESFGACTLRVSHVTGAGADQTGLRFRAKGGQETEVVVQDPDLAAVVRQRLAAPGERLFCYQADGGPAGVGPRDVNAYLARAMGGAFTSKDLRTWAASVLLLERLRRAGPRAGRRPRLRVLRRAVEDVAGTLHHTPAVCRRSYVHPLVAAAYHDDSLERRVRDALPVPGLWPQEARLLALLRSYS